MPADLSRKDRQLDALREVANVASGHAATAMSRLSGQRVMIGVPQLAVASLDELPALVSPTNERLATVILRFLDGLEGRLLFVLPETQARPLANLLLERTEAALGIFDELSMSALQETGNLIGGAYSAAVGDLIGRRILISTPVFRMIPSPGMLSLPTWALQSGPEIAVWLRMEFQLGTPVVRVRGSIVLLVAEETVTALMAALAASG